MDMMNCSDSDDYPVLSTRRPICLPGGATRIALIVNMAVVMILGVVGNVFTLIALPYVKLKYRQEFSVLQTSSAYLIFHLSFCDLMYCLLGFPNFIQVYYIGYYPYSANSCKYLGMIRNIVSYADFSTLGVISVCVSTRIINKVHLHDRIFKGWRIIIVCLCIWLFAFAYVSSDVFEITGTYGWTASVYGCDAVVSETKLGHKDVEGVNHYLGVLLNLLIIFISYTLVGIKLLKDRRQVRRSDIAPVVVKEMEDASTQTMWTLVFLTLSYVVFLIPSLLTSWTNSVKPISKDPRIKAGVASLYFWLYGANFIIYVTTSKRLRDAYKTFLGDMFCSKTFNTDSPSTSSHPWWSSIVRVISNTVKNSELNPNVTVSNLEGTNEASDDDQNITQDMKNEDIQWSTAL